MKVYTGIGDQGKTNILGEKGVSKHDVRVEAYGTVDELNSMLGVLTTYPATNPFTDQLRWIQNHLFTIGSILASTEDARSKLKLSGVGTQEIEQLEKWIDEQTENLEPLQSFILPGSCIENATCHMARTICRRAERRTVELSGQTTVEPAILIFLNRLSDYFFTLARTMSSVTGNQDVIWQPKKD